MTWTYEQRIDAFARQWMTEHPERLASQLYRNTQIDNSQLITLYCRFEDGYSYSEYTYDPATFEIGFLVPVANVGMRAAFSVSMQYGEEEIDVGVILRGVLAVDVDKWRKKELP